MVKRDYLRRVIVFEDHFKTFRKTIDRDALMKKNFDQKNK